MKVFKPHPLYEKILVNPNGTLKSEKTGVIYKLSLTKSGYLDLKYTTGSRTDRSRTVLNLKAHRLVAETFIPNPKNLKTVNHINGVKTDNRVTNLEWLSSSDNLKKSWEKGYHKGHPISKEHRKLVNRGIREKWKKGLIKRKRKEGRFA